jgi:ketosteroid isomerase-like protein
MTLRPTVLSLAACLAFAAPAFATTHGEAHGPEAPAPAPTTIVDSSPEAAVDEFGAALQRGDLARAGALLADDVLVLEAGGAERSKAEYMASHAGADAEFLKQAHVQQGQRTSRVLGDTAWVGTESEVHATRDGKPATYLSAETMVLQRGADGWRIVHIHWSSRPKPQE